MSVCPTDAPRTSIVNGVDRARPFVPLGTLLRFCDCRPVDSMLGTGCSTRVRLTSSRPVPRTSPHRLTPPEVRAINEMVTALEHRHVPTRHARHLGAAARQSVGLVPGPGTTSCGSSAGAALGSACTRRSRRSAFARREPTRYGTSTPSVRSVGTPRRGGVDSRQQVCEQSKRRHSRQQPQRRVSQRSQAQNEKQPAMSPTDARTYTIGVLIDSLSQRR
jgi:hypothetical protein